MGNSPGGNPFSIRNGGTVQAKAASPQAQAEKKKSPPLPQYNEPTVEDILTKKTVLAIGHRGPAVKYVQTLLTIAADGKYQQITLDAVKNFQRHNGLVDDGKVGEKTLAKLTSSYEAAIKDKNWTQAALLLCGRSDAELKAALTPLKQKELDEMKKGAAKHPWSARVIKVIDSLWQRSITPGEQALLDRLKGLGNAAHKEGQEGANFKTVLDSFSKELEKRLQVPEPTPETRLVVKALELWSKDTGNQWGEGSWDSNDLKLSSKDYATVPSSQYKCNAYVAEVITTTLGLVFKVHESSESKGKYFPYQAREWGDAQCSISQYPVTATPAMGDIWSSGTHVGIFLWKEGEQQIYISARDDKNGVLGVKAGLQKEHGIQIKFLNTTGVFRRYTP